MKLNKEVVSYLVFGVLTTLTNIVSYADSLRKYLTWIIN